MARVAAGQPSAGLQRWWQELLAARHRVERDAENLFGRPRRARSAAAHTRRPRHVLHAPHDGVWYLAAHVAL